MNVNNTNINECLGVGIIGCGSISGAYLELGPLYDGFEIRAVADINPVAAKERAQEFDLRATSVEELLTADDIQVIVNLTIPEVHFDITRQILEAGKHAYSEKPFVLTLAEGEKLRALASKNNLRVGSAPDTFLGGAHQQARQLIDEDLIGNVVAGTAHVMGHGMEHWHPNPDFFYQPGAGPVLDIGPYYITNLVQLLGPITQVAALSSSASATRTITSEPRNGETIPVNTATNLHALLKFKQGATITLSTSWDVWAHQHNNMELYGRTGTLLVPDPNFFGGQLQASNQSGRFDPVPIDDHPLGRPNQLHPGMGWIANYRTAGLADMIQAIQTGRDHRCSLELAIHVVDAMTAIIKSGETGSFIQLSTSCERPAALNALDAQSLLKDSEAHE